MPRLRLVCLPAVLVVFACIARETCAATPLASNTASVQLAQAPEDDAVACRRAPTKECVFALAAATALSFDSPERAHRELVRVIEAQVTVGDLAGALENVRRLEADNSTSHRDFIKIATVFSDSSEEDAAREVFRSAITIAGAISRPSARAYAFVEIAAAAAAVGDRTTAQEAVTLATAMAKTPIPPSLRAEILKSIAEVQATVGSYTSAMNAVALISDPSDRVLPLAYIARTQAASGHRSAAKDVVQVALTAAALTTSQDRTQSLLLIAAAANDIGDHATASELIEVILAMAARMGDSRWRAWTLHEIAQLQIATGNLVAALDTAETIEHGRQDDAKAREGATADEGIRSSIVVVGHRDLALDQVARAQAQAGDLEAALVTARKISEPYWRTQVLIGLASGRMKVGETEAARLIMSEAVSTSDRVDARSRHTLLFMGGDALATLVALGDVDRAMTIAETIEDSQFRRSVLHQTAEVWGQTADAAAIEMMDDPYIRAVALATMAKQRAIARDVDAAKRGVHAALRASNEIDDPEMRVWVLLAIGEAQAAAGDIDGCRAVMDAIFAATDEIDGSWFRFSAIRSFANAQARSGNYAAALVALDQVRDPWYRLQALLDIAGAVPQSR